MLNNLIWIIACCILVIGVIITILPIIVAFTKKVKLNKTSKWFNEADFLGNQKQRLIDHEIRMEGTLIYWKNKATAHNRLHNARVIWSLISAVILPVLIQFYDNKNLWSIAFMTGLTTWTGFIVALAHGLKSEEMFRGFRECESDYYDIARELLDLKISGSNRIEEKVNQFIKEAENIRKVGRKVETNSPPSGRFI